MTPSASGEAREAVSSLADVSSLRAHSCSGLQARRGLEALEGGREGLGARGGPGASPTLPGLRLGWHCPPPRPSGPLLSGPPGNSCSADPSQTAVSGRTHSGRVLRVPSSCTSGVRPFSGWWASGILGPLLGVAAQPGPGLCAREASTRNRRPGLCLPGAPDRTAPGRITLRVTSAGSGSPLTAPVTPSGKGQVTRGKLRPGGKAAGSRPLSAACWL